MNDPHDPFEQYEPPAPVDAPKPKHKRGGNPHKAPARSNDLRFNVVVPHNFMIAGVEQTIWTIVGSAFVKDGSRPGWTIKIRDGISVSGTVYIFPNDRDKE